MDAGTSSSATCRVFAITRAELTIQKPGTVERYKLWSTIEDSAERLLQPAALSLIVHDIDDINQQLEKGFYFFSDVKREGLMLYDSQRLKLAEAQKPSLEQRREYAESCFAQWLESANRFHFLFETALTNGWTSEAAFQLHQATERYFV